MHQPGYVTIIVADMRQAIINNHADLNMVMMRVTDSMSQPVNKQFSGEVRVRQTVGFFVIGGFMF